MLLRVEREKCERSSSIVETRALQLPPSKWIIILFVENNVLCAQNIKAKWLKIFHKSNKFFHTTRFFVKERFVVSLRHKFQTTKSFSKKIWPPSTYCSWWIFLFFLIISSICFLYFNFNVDISSSSWAFCIEERRETVRLHMLMHAELNKSKERSIYWQIPRLLVAACRILKQVDWPYGDRRLFNKSLHRSHSLGQNITRRIVIFTFCPMLRPSKYQQELVQIVIKKNKTTKSSNNWKILWLRSIDGLLLIIQIRLSDIRWKICSKYERCASIYERFFVAFDDVMKKNVRRVRRSCWAKFKVRTLTSSLGKTIEIWSFSHWLPTTFTSFGN